MSATFPLSDVSTSLHCTSQLFTGSAVSFVSCMYMRIQGIMCIWRVGLTLAFEGFSLAVSSGD